MKYKDFKNYEINKDGSIWSYNRKHFLTPTPDGSGYLQVKLYKDGVPYPLKVHKIVFETFNHPIPDGFEIDHINGNEKDNRVENLRCVTHPENCRNEITYQRFLEAIHSPEYIEKQKINADKKRGVPFSEETKKKMSDVRKGIPPSKKCLDASLKKRQKTIYCYTKDYELVKTYYPLKSVKEDGFNREVIWAAIKKNKMYRGYIWSYEPIDRIEHEDVTIE